MIETHLLLVLPLNGLPHFFPFAEFSQFPMRAWNVPALQETQIHLLPRNLFLQVIERVELSKAFFEVGKLINFLS